MRMRKKINYLEKESSDLRLTIAELLDQLKECDDYLREAYGPQLEFSFNDPQFSAPAKSKISEMRNRIDSLERKNHTYAPILRDKIDSAISELINSHPNKQELKENI